MLQIAQMILQLHIWFVQKALDILFPSDRERMESTGKEKRGVTEGKEKPLIFVMVELLMGT